MIKINHKRVQEIILKFKICNMYMQGQKKGKNINKIGHRQNTNYTAPFYSAITFTYKTIYY